MLLGKADGEGLDFFYSSLCGHRWTPHTLCDRPSLLNNVGSAAAQDVTTTAAIASTAILNLSFTREVTPYLPIVTFQLHYLDVDYHFRENGREPEPMLDDES